METIAVIAGNVFEFQLLMHELSKNAKMLVTQKTQAIIDGVKYVYISDRNKLKGLHLNDYFIYGTCRDRVDFDQIIDELKVIPLSKPKDPIYHVDGGDDWGIAGRQLPK